MVMAEGNTYNTGGGCRFRGLTLLEASVCLMMVVFLAGLTFISLGHLLPKIRFERQASNIVRMFQMASQAASETPRRYAVMIDFIENSCILYEVNTSQPYSNGFETLRDEDVIDTISLSEGCELYYVQFDDSDETIDATNETGKALFVAGRNGWDFGGKVVFFDNDEKEHCILISRLNKNVELYDYDVPIPEPVFDLQF